MTLLFVFAGGAIGAPCRFLLDRFVQRRLNGVFPWGTLTVNVLGSLILGALYGTAGSGNAMALLGTGFCGALTTFSTLGFETLRLAEDGSYLEAALNAGANLLLGLVAAAGAYALTAAV